MSTLEVEPAVASSVFSQGLDTVRQFAANLALHGEEWGLIGPREPERLWSRHLLNCGLVAPLLRPGHVFDVGSGGGLPGLVLAAARPDVTLTLIEPMERRVTWLNRQVRELGLHNVEVCRARAEDAPLRGQADQVTARAVSALRTLIPLVVPLTRPGGELILMKGESAQREIEDASKQIRAAKLEGVQVITLGEGLLDHPTWVVRATVGVTQP